MSTQQRGGYRDVDEIRDGDTSVIVVISQRVGRAHYTCSFFKVFEKEGREERTTFFDPSKHFDAIKRLMPRVEKRIQELQDGRELAGGQRS